LRLKVADAIFPRFDLQTVPPNVCVKSAPQNKDVMRKPVRLKAEGLDPMIETENEKASWKEDCM